MKLSPKNTLQKSKQSNNAASSRTRVPDTEDLIHKIATNYDLATRIYIQNMADGYGIGFGKMAGLILKDMRLDDQAAERGQDGRMP